MNKKRKIKRATKQYFIVALICIIVIGSAAIFTSLVFIRQIREEFQTLLEEANYEREINQRSVYVAVLDILAGDYVTLEKVELRTVYASQPQGTYITKEGIGKLAVVDIPAETHVINGMLTANLVSSELREIEYNVINISTNIISNDTIDVRIFYPNGESYVVLSKKILKGLMQETATCFLWLNEEELLRMSAAIVDAGLYPGSKLYVTKYIEPSIQEGSIITYTPSLSILSILESNPNVVERYSQELNKEVRKALENRMADSMELDVSAINWEINSKNQLATIVSPLPTSAPNTEVILNPTLPTPTLIANTTPTPAMLNENSFTEETIGGDIRREESDFFFYTQEETARDGDIEYGE